MDGLVATSVTSPPNPAPRRVMRGNKGQEHKP
jgi:hypothetical protein